MTITAPVIDLLRSTPTHEDRTVCVHLVEQLADWPGQSREIPEPFVQPVEVIAGVARFVVGAGDVPVEGP
jgi:hypothetical protein